MTNNRSRKIEIRERFKAFANHIPVQIGVDLMPSRSEILYCQGTCCPRPSCLARSRVVLTATASCTAMPTLLNKVIRDGAKLAEAVDFGSLESRKKRLPSCAISGFIIRIRECSVKWKRCCSRAT